MYTHIRTHLYMQSSESRNRSTLEHVYMIGLRELHLACMYVYVYVCMCTHIRTHLYMQSFESRNRSTLEHVYMIRLRELHLACMYVYVYVCMYMYVCRHTYAVNIHTHTFVRELEMDRP